MKRQAPRQKRNTLGLKLCRNCDNLVAKGRKSYCSQQCADDFASKYFPSHTRHKVFQRDRGVCAKCGCDTEKLRRIFRNVRPTIGSEAARQIFKELGFHGGYTGGGWWQADHIIEVARGGWQAGRGIDNFRTLCTPCHKEETARLVGELARERRASPLFAAQGVPNA